MRFILLTMILATPAWAEMKFVTDPKMCAMDEMARLEQGMTFDGQSFWAIEYNCQLERPIAMPSFTGYQTQIRAGYCEEPGVIMPTVFVIRSSQDEPGVLYTYSDETEYGSEAEAAGKFFHCAP